MRLLHVAGETASAKSAGRPKRPHCLKGTLAEPTPRRWPSLALRAPRTSACSAELCCSRRFRKGGGSHSRLCIAVARACACARCLDAPSPARAQRSVHSCMGAMRSSGALRWAACAAICAAAVVVGAPTPAGTPAKPPPFDVQETSTQLFLDIAGAPPPPVAGTLAHSGTVVRCLGAAAHINGASAPPRAGIVLQCLGAAARGCTFFD